MSHPLSELLAELEAAEIVFTLGRHRPDTVVVTPTAVGERVEVDVFADGHVEMARSPDSEAVGGGADVVREIVAAIRE